MKLTFAILLLLTLGLLALEPQLTRQESQLLEQLQALSPKEAADALPTKLPKDASSALLFSCGVIYWKAGNPLAAQEAFLAAVAKEPAFHRARLNAAKLMMNAGDYPQAENHLMILIGYPENLASSDIWKMLAACQLKKGNLLGAEASARQAIALLPNDPAPRRLLLQALLPQKERAPEAIALARLVLEADSSQSEFWSVYTNLLIHANRIEEAMAALLCARAMNAATPEMLSLLAELQIRQGLFPQAARTIETGNFPAQRRSQLIQLLEQKGADNLAQKLREAVKEATP